MSFELPLAVRADIADLAPYRSPQQPARYRMNTNESPYPPPAELLDEVFAEVKGASLNRYPDHGARALVEAVSRHVSWPGEGIAVANGSNEVLLHLFLAYGGPRRRVLVFEPTYSLHSTIARVTGTEVIAARRRDDFRIDSEAGAEAVRGTAPDILVVCSPNNPTGGCEEIEVVEALLDAAPGLVLVDEAYVEFAGAAHELQRLLGAHPNLVIVKTLSKAWRLAGVRLGYMLAAPEIVAAIARVRLPYHLSSFSQAIGIAALRRADDALQHVRAITEQRDRIARGLDELGAETFDSHANFVLFRVPGARRVWTALLANGVLVRDYSEADGLRDCLRVTAGTSEETDAFLSAMKGALGGG